MRLLISVAIAAMTSATSAAEPVLDPHLPYRAKPSVEVNYTIDFRVIVTAPSGTKKLRVWAPVPQDDAGQKVGEGEWSVFPTNVKPSFHTEKVFGNRFAYFEFDAPQGAQIIAFKFRAAVRQLNWSLDPAKVVRVNKWPETFDPYRRAEKSIVVDDRFKRLASEITAGMQGPNSELSAIIDWVHDNLTYDHSNTSLIASSEHALSKKRGDCSDYHGLCSSLGRSLGVPTRVTYGLHLFPKNLPCHCKLEAYLAPYGWVSFDVSETQRLVKTVRADKKLDDAAKSRIVQAALDRMRAGFRDNTWLLCTKGTDYELAPPATRKAPLISTIYAEADGVALPMPDPADPSKKEFGWMTAHDFKADQKMTYPFRDWTSLIQ